VSGRERTASPVHVSAADRALFAACEASDTAPRVCAACGIRAPRPGREHCAVCGNTGRGARATASALAAARGDRPARRKLAFWHADVIVRCARCDGPCDPAHDWRDAHGRRLCGGCAHAAHEREGTSAL